MRDFPWQAGKCALRQVGSVFAEPNRLFLTPHFFGITLVLSQPTRYRLTLATSSLCATLPLLAQAPSSPTVSCLHLHHTHLITPPFLTKTNREPPKCPLQPRPRRDLALCSLSSHANELCLLPQLRLSLHPSRCFLQGGALRSLVGPLAGALLLLRGAVAVSKGPCHPHSANPPRSKSLQARLDDLAWPSPVYSQFYQYPDWPRLPH